jgi:hypothetical protein
MSDDIPRDLNVVAMHFPDKDDDYSDGAPDQVDIDEWEPHEGPNFASVLSATSSGFEHISRDPQRAASTWKAEVRKIAGRCLPPTRKNHQRAQLVFGRVQAGKTSNFTGLISLLSDNDYELFIVLAGINLNLRTQTFDRLVNDLAVASDPRFEIIPSNTVVPWRTEAHRISQTIKRQDNPTGFAARFRKKLIYVVLKEDDNLKWLNGIISELQSDYTGAENLNRASVLIIDDEVDQASPDPYTNDANRVGAIHAQIGQLRENIGTHSYVGYTATPYANLFMEEGNRLRCEVVSVLDPGMDYVGPEILFSSKAPQFGREIDDWDPSRSTIPRSLVTSFASFIAQATIVNGPFDLRERFLESPFLSNTDSTTPVSMLVQPHQQTSYASKIFFELEGLRASWLSAIETPISPSGIRDIAWVNLWELELKPAFAGFGIESDDISDEIIERAETIIAELEIREINGPGRERGFEFPSNKEFGTKPAWVLIGGQLLDRGQTLPNLVNTYMPRSPGGAGAATVRGNVDTLQQRGRFYGQRGQYLSLLRGSFDSDTLETYREIARIEPINIRALRRLSDTGLGIQKLPLVIELGTGNLRAASPNKIPRGTISLSNSTWLFRQLWYSQGGTSTESIARIAAITKQNGTVAVDAKSINRRPGFSNHLFECEVATAIELLEDWACVSREKILFQTAVALLKEHSESGHETIDLHLMARPDSNPSSLESHGEYRSASIATNFSHRGEKPGDLRITGLTSSNDARFLREERAAIQIHFFDIRVGREDGTTETYMNQVGLAVSFKNSSRLNVYEGRGQ